MESSMNLSDVYVFKKVASTLSFTKAAIQIGVSRSAVSKQVSRLENGSAAGAAALPAKPATDVMSVVTEMSERLARLEARQRVGVLGWLFGVKDKTEGRPKSG